MPRFGAKIALQTTVGVNINCHINAKVHFKTVCIRVCIHVLVHVRAYLYKPTCGQAYAPVATLWIVG